MQVGDIKAAFFKNHIFQLESHRKTGNKHATIQNFLKASIITSTMWRKKLQLPNSQYCYQHNVVEKKFKLITMSMVSRKRIWVKISIYLF